MLEVKLFVEARQLLSRACEMSKDVLEEGWPENLPTIFSNYFCLKRIGYSAAAVKVIEHLRSMAALMPSTTYTFRCLLDNLVQLDQHVEEIYSIAWKCWEATMANHLEPLNPTLLSSRLERILSPGSGTDMQDAERLLRALAIECEHTYGKSDTRYWHILRALARNLCDQGRDEEAEQVGLHLIQEVENAEEQLYWTMYALDITSLAQHNQFKDDLAQNSLERCIDIATQHYGKDDSVTIKYSLRLERWLRSWGRQRKAEELAAQRSQILGSPVIEELID